jgi:hypothetical protein
MDSAANSNAASKKISKNISSIASSSSGMGSVYYYAPSLSNVTRLGVVQCLAGGPAFEFRDTMCGVHFAFLFFAKGGTLFSSRPVPPESGTEVFLANAWLVTGKTQGRLKSRDMSEVLVKRDL